jgi:hypothetical protein
MIARPNKDKGDGSPSGESYRGIPPVAGLCSFAEAARDGLSVEACVQRLKRYHYALRRLHEIFTARITAEPIYELKTAFSLHAHICAEHVAVLRKRVGEMREPPLGLEAVPDPNLGIFFDEILGAPATEELVAGLYEKAIPALVAAFERHLADTNTLADYPSVRLCRFALLELADLDRFGKQTVRCLVDPGARGRMADWLALLDRCLAAAGGLDGASAPAGSGIARQHSARAYVYDRKPRRDERFPDPYNRGVNAEAFIYNEKLPPEPKMLMLFFRRIREIEIPEMMASVITETKGKPWDYYREMSRQLWDEARHSLMGEVGFVSLGVDWRKAMINATYALIMNTRLNPLERHGVLYFVEQGLMAKTGKRYEWEVGLASQNHLAGLFQDYDWADEVLHARIGRDWYIPEFKDTKEALAFGDDRWNVLFTGWKAWRDQGLTQHRNWWPDLYRDACSKQGVAPDPEVLNFAETYEHRRADLKKVPAATGTE